jgi:putative nucleotidyltransferase with HDIG domain
LPGSPSHLFRRFFDVLTAKALTPDERVAVVGWLGPDLAGIFFAQSVADQRHGYHAVSVVRSRGESSPDVIVAALLHDVGKRHSRLGVIGRSVASILMKLSLPMSERMSIYRDHGEVGARELGSLGAPSLAIDFALHHHGARPPTIEPGIWDLLVAADQPPKTSTAPDSRITSQDK